jgi:hypothetical protein
VLMTFLLALRGDPRAAGGSGLVIGGGPTMAPARVGAAALKT